MRRGFLSIFLTVYFLLPSVEFAQAGKLIFSTQEQVYADALIVPCRDQDRLAALTELFKRAGAIEADIRIDEFKKGKNFVVTFPGTDEGYIIVGAHYDKVEEGCGAIDNWSGVVILSHLYKTVRQTKTHHTFLFVGFGREEEGLEGSRAMAQAISKQERQDYCAMINLDSFGLAIPQILSNVTTSSLEKITRKVAKEEELPIATANIYIAGADSTPFKEKGIPAVTLHGLSAEWQKILHKSGDKPERILAQSVYLGYVLAVDLMAQLDKGGCNTLK
jgi:Iap family predicted aminopeptidase